MKKMTIVVLSLFFLVQTAQSQIIETQGRLSNSVYIFEGNEQVDGTANVTTHTRLYQTLRFTAKFKSLSNLKVNLAGRILTDLGNSDLADEYRYRAYRVSVSGNNLFNNTLDFEIGRQFLHPGLVLGSIDGVNLLYRPVRNLGIQVYGGVESHLLNALNIYKTNDAMLYGGSIRYNKFLKTNVQVVYLQKQNDGKAIWQIAGLNMINRSVDNLSLILQTHYDLVNSRLHRLYASTSYHLNKLSANVYFKQQRPQIYGDSYFQIFDVSAYQLLGLNLAYAISKRFSLSGTMQGVQLEEGYGNRYMLSLDDHNGSLGISYETGDLGEQFGLMLDYGYEIIPDLTGSFSVDFSRYRFEEIYEFEKQLANAVGLNYNFSENWIFNLEYQWLNNRFMDSDQRVLNHIHFIW